MKTLDDLAMILAKKSPIGKWHDAALGPAYTGSRLSTAQGDLEVGHPETPAGRDSRRRMVFSALKMARAASVSRGALRSIYAFPGHGAREFATGPSLAGFLYALRATTPFEGGNRLPGPNRHSCQRYLYAPGPA